MRKLLFLFIGIFLCNSAFAQTGDLTDTKIAFHSYRDEIYYIYVINSDGTNETRLTKSNAASLYPCWSPDGSKIAFRSNLDAIWFDIFVMNSDGTNKVNLTNKRFDDMEPSWSPDGSKIVFARPDRMDSNWGIYVMNSDGSNQTRLTKSSEDDYNPSWSPFLTPGTDNLTDTKIAFESDRDRRGNYEIYVMNSDGSNQTRLTNSGGRGPSWSPDGAKIAFNSSRDGGLHEIYVMNSDGSNQTRLTNDSFHNTHPSWSPFLLATGIEDNNPNRIPDKFAFAQNYPNPFNPETTIRFELPTVSNVTLKIYNIRGQEVKTLVSKHMPAGYHNVVWDGTNNSGRQVSTGMYIYQLIAGEFSSVKKMLFIK